MEQLTRRCHLRSVPVNLLVPFEDILIPLLLQHSLILLYLLWRQWSSWWHCCLGHSKNCSDDDDNDDNPPCSAVSLRYLSYVYRTFQQAQQSYDTPFYQIPVRANSHPVPFHNLSIHFGAQTEPAVAVSMHFMWLMWQCNTFTVHWWVES